VSCSWVLAVLDRASPDYCNELRYGYRMFSAWMGRSSVESSRVCVTPRPYNGPDGDDGRGVGGDVQQLLYDARPLVVAAESRHRDKHMGYIPL